MTIVDERVLRQRSILFFVLVSIFVIVVICVSSVIYANFWAGHKLVKKGRPNILFIVVDDLRPALGCYGDKIAITPNIDQLASKSVLFTNAFAQQALCAPSRTSFLTSRRPDSLHLYDAGSYWRDDVWNFTTLPEHFKNHGYETISIGKVFHHGSVSNKTDDYPYSWSEPPYRPPTQMYKMEKVCPSSDGALHMNLICPINVEEQPGGSLPDIESTEYAIKYLENRTDSDPAFFLGLGYYKPHIPFKFPKKYLNLYPIDTIDLAPNNEKPKGMPDVAWNPWVDLRLREDVQALKVGFPFGPLPENFQKLVRQGYYASLSYMDDQLGKVLQVLEDTNYASNTIIVLLGDHGWSLGEHGEWSKYSNFEVSLKVPLLVYVPGLTDDSEDREKFHHVELPIWPEPSNQTSALSTAYHAKFVSNDFVELVDLFPTVAELANIAVPAICKLNSSQTNFCSEGISFQPVIENTMSPSRYFAWKSAVFSQYPRPSETPINVSDQPALKDITIMGYTIRTEEYRYTEWLDFNNTTFRPNWANIIEEELYNKNNDPDEVHNVADLAEYSDIVIKLRKELRNGWRGALPAGLFESPIYKRYSKKSCDSSNSKRHAEEIEGNSTFWKLVKLLFPLC